MASDVATTFGWVRVLAPNYTNKHLILSGAATSKLAFHIQ